MIELDNDFIEKYLTELNEWDAVDKLEIARKALKNVLALRLYRGDYDLVAYKGDIDLAILKAFTD